MDSTKAIEEKLVKAEQRRLARFEKNTESIDERTIRVQCKLMEQICPKSPTVVSDKIKQVQMRKDELLAAKLARLVEHHAKVGFTAVNAKKAADEIDRKYAQLEKEKAADERVRKIQEEKKAKAAAMANRRTHLKKAVDAKLETAEQSLNVSEFELVESYL